MKSTRSLERAVHNSGDPGLLGGEDGQQYPCFVMGLVPAD